MSMTIEKEKLNSYFRWKARISNRRQHDRRLAEFGLRILGRKMSTKKWGQFDRGWRITAGLTIAEWGLKREGREEREGGGNWEFFNRRLHIAAEAVQGLRRLGGWAELKIIIA